MIELKTLVDKMVKITDTDGNIYTGKVIEYVFPEDNEPEVESIVLDSPVKNGFKLNNYLMELKATEIQSIDIVD